MGCDILSGGGPGLMQAANEGAHSVDPKGRGRSIGINIELPFEQQVNPFVTQASEHRTFFSRLHHFMIMSDAFVVTPGGIGSLLELALVWQLLQVRHTLQHAADPRRAKCGPSWSSGAGATCSVEGSELASAIDFEIPHCVNTIEEALALIRENRAAWLASQPQ